MKPILIIIALLAVGFLISGCSTEPSDDLSNPNDSDLGYDEPIDPDIGTLDDIPVSEDIPK